MMIVLLDFLMRLCPFIYPVVIHDVGGIHAARSGLRTNDHIIAIDDEMVLGSYRSEKEIKRMLDDGEIGEMVYISILRIVNREEDDYNTNGVVDSSRRSGSSSNNNKNNNDVSNLPKYQHHLYGWDRSIQSILPSLSCQSSCLNLRHTAAEAVTERFYAVMREYVPTSPLIQHVMPCRQGSYLGEYCPTYIHTYIYIYIYIYIFIYEHRYIHAMR